MKLSNLFTHFIAAIIISGVMMLIYATVQQNFRTEANDPQLQIARDISYRLNKNLPVDHLLPKDTIELSESLSVFIELFDNNGKVIFSTATLDGKIPQPPLGVLDYAKSHEENAISWQPRNGVREAIIIRAVHSSNVAYVLAGRSLQEAENRISNLIWMVFICWLICLGIILIHYVFQFYWSRKNS